jgi:hypothetical protein
MRAACCAAWRAFPRPAPLLGLPDFAGLHARCQKHSPPSHALVLDFLQSRENLDDCAML